jgi:hypothetical protein
MHRRDLTSGEASILGMIQDSRGSQNSIDEVFFSDSDEAVIFVTSIDGTETVVANLTNLATFRADGSIPSDDELKRKWLQL